MILICNLSEIWVFSQIDRLYNIYFPPHFFKLWKTKMPSEMWVLLFTLPSCSLDSNCFITIPYKTNLPLLSFLFTFLLSEPLLFLWVKGIVKKCSKKLLSFCGIWRPRALFPFSSPETQALKLRWSGFTLDAPERLHSLCRAWNPEIIWDTLL